MRRSNLEKTMVAGAIGLALVRAALGVARKAGSAADGRKYDVVIANGRAVRAPIS